MRLLERFLTIMHVKSKRSFNLLLMEKVTNLPWAVRCWQPSNNHALPRHSSAGRDSCLTSVFHSESHSLPGLRSSSLETERVRQTIKKSFPPQWWCPRKKVTGPFGVVWPSTDRSEVCIQPHKLPGCCQEPKSFALWTNCERSTVVQCRWFWRKYRGTESSCRKDDVVCSVYHQTLEYGSVEGKS